MSADSKFSLDLSAFVKKAHRNADQVIRKIVLDLGTRIVMRSPVGDASLWKSEPPKGYTGGRFRANWQYGEGAPPAGSLAETDKTGLVSINRINAGLKPAAAGKVHFVVNNLPYAIPLEYGHSKQAPAGMVGVTIVEYQSIVARIAKEANQ